MAAYPALPTLPSSVAVRLDGYIPVRASNGTLKVRKMMSSDKMEFSLDHEINSAQKTSLENHYAADKTNSFSYTWPGVGGGTYTVKYVMAPQYQEQPGGWYKAKVSLAEE